MTSLEDASVIVWSSDSETTVHDSEIFSNLNPDLEIACVTPLSAAEFGAPSFARHHQSSAAGCSATWQALNDAIKVTRGPAVALIAADSLPERGWLKRLATSLRDTRVGCVCGTVMTSDNVDREDLQRWPLSGILGSVFPSLDNVMLRKEAFEQAGGLNSDLDEAAPIDFGRRLLNDTDWVLVCEPDAVVTKRPRNPLCMFDIERATHLSIANWLGETGRLDELSHAAAVDRVRRALTPSGTAAAGCDAFRGDPTSARGAKLSRSSGALAGLLDHAVNSASGMTQKACTNCGCTRFSAGPGGRLVAGQAPQCRNCGSLERHRAVCLILEAFRKKKLLPGRSLSVGDPLRAEMRCYEYHNHLTTAQCLNQKGVMDVDLAIALNAFASAPCRDLAATLESIAQQLKPDGSLLIVERLRSRSTATKQQESGGYSIGADFAGILADLLPNVTVAPTLLADPITGEEYLGLVANRERSVASAIVLEAQSFERNQVG